MTNRHIQSMTSGFGASLGFDARLRAEATAWLDRRAAAGEDLVTSAELSNFEFEGQRQPLVAVQQGIWKPRQLDAALSIRTTFTRPGAPPPYEDAQGPDGLLRYKYRGTDPQHYENRALRRAMNDGLPVVPNGLALCKIHHAAYDQNIIGVRPDLVVDVRADILAEIDGPMLRHGIQEMKGIRLTVPRERAARPDRQRLDERYEQFRLAG